MNEKQVEIKIDNLEISKAAAKLIVNATEDILVHMDDIAMTKADLARKLDKSRAHISAIFSGQRNLTLKTFSDICFAVGVEPDVLLVDRASRKIVNYSKARVLLTSNRKNDVWQKNEDSMSTIVDIGKYINKRKSKKIPLSEDPQGEKYAYA